MFNPNRKIERKGFFVYTQLQFFILTIEIIVCSTKGNSTQRRKGAKKRKEVIIQPSLRFFASLRLCVELCVVLCFLMFLPLRAQGADEVLKSRQPNWRTKILESFPEGGVQKVLFYEPAAREEVDIPVKVVSYYPSGEMRNETDLTVLPKDDPVALSSGTRVVPHGFSVDYWPSGVAERVSFYEKGKLHGNFYGYDEHSTLIERGTYSQGKLTGLLERYHSDGTKAFQAHYEEGVLEGELTEWHPNGVVKSTQYYTRGLLNGDRQKPAMRLYSDDATLIQTQDFRLGRPYSGGQIAPQAKHREKYSGLPLNIDEDTTDKKSSGTQYEGVQKTFYPNGQIKTLITYRNGLLDGQKAFWSSQGELLEEAYYQNGDLEGRYYQRLQDGTEIISQYRHHRLHGLEQAFYPNPGSDVKVKAREATYADGLLDGELALYNREGIKVASSLYKQGKRDGLSTIYATDGRVMMTAEYRDDKKDGAASEYFSSGKMRRQTRFVDDVEEGEEKVFYESGKPAAVRHYSKGKLDGEAKEWDEEGKLIFEAKYRDGMPHGRFCKGGKDLNFE